MQLMPVICMQLSYVNLIVLVWISCITGQTPDRYYGRVPVSDYMGSVWCPCLPLENVQQACDQYLAFLLRLGNEFYTILLI